MTKRGKCRAAGCRAEFIAPECAAALSVSHRKASMWVSLTSRQSFLLKHVLQTGSASQSLPIETNKLPLASLTSLQSYIFWTLAVVFQLSPWVQILFLSNIPPHVNFDPDLHSYILRLRGSHLSPGRLLVVVHLVAHRLLPVDCFGLEGDIKRERSEVSID